MEPQKSQFNRNLFILLAILYALTVGAFIYAEWAADPVNAKLWMALLNVLILSIPLVLLYGSIYVLVVAWREHSALGQVSPRLAKIIHWAPRAAAILIIFFVMIVLLVFAWKRPAVGFVLFLVAAALFAIFTVRDIYALPNLLLFVLPILLIAFLFYADWKWLTPEPPAQVDAAA
jgi:hypothetical protein